MSGPASLSDLAGRMAAVVGARNCFSAGPDLLTYECDGLTHGRTRPDLVVLPGSTAEVVEVVRLARASGRPIVPRGSGTGLSGGARPVPGSVVVALSRMRRILEVNLEDGWVRVEPGVLNLDVTKHVSAAGYYYAPDPSSQSICSIGGNVAENSGGAHCLKYGFTVNHVLGARLVLHDGKVVDIGGPALDAPRARPARRAGGQRGHAGHRHRGDAAAAPQAGGHPDLLRHLPLHRRGRRGGLAHHRRRHPPGRHRDDGPAGHRGGQGRHRARLARRRAPRCSWTPTARWPRWRTSPPAP